MDIPNEALSRYPEDYKTIGGSAMERRAFTAGAEWARRELEARVVELEAVIAEALKRHDSGPTHDILSAAPSVVLADHDREVAARAVRQERAWVKLNRILDENGGQDTDEYRAAWAEWEAIVQANPLRAADQNGEHA